MSTENKKWPLWKTLMFIIMPLFAYHSYKSYWETNFVIPIFGTVILFIVSAFMKSVHEDNEAKKLDPDHVSMIDVLKPITAIWLIIKFPAIVIFIIAAIMATKSVYFS